MNRHIVLLGLMASGKTTVGGLLARRLDRPFFDSDLEVAARHGLTGGELARRDGVAALHRHEAEILLDALTHRPWSVIAGAASVVDDATCRRALTEAWVVMLEATPETVAPRLAKGAHRRDLEDPVAELAEQRARRPYQSVAHHIIPVDGLVPSEIAERIQAVL